MSSRFLRAGTQISFGAPATPMPDVIADAIGHLVQQVPGITEAHLPQCFIEGDTEARQVLVIGVRDMEAVPRLIQELTDLLKPVVPVGKLIDIIPFQESKVPTAVRAAGCRIFGQANRPWWKLW